jgi:MSHA biogenesis protein MshJ
MKEQIAKLQGWFSGLNKREQWLVGITVIVAILVIWDSFFFSPRSEKNAAARSQISSLEQRITSLETGLVPLRIALQQDPDKETKERIQSLKQQIEGTIAEIRDSSDELVTPQQMARALEDVLRQNKELTLVRVQSLATIPLYEEGVEVEETPKRNAKQEEKPVPLAFRHPMEIEFRGNYQQVVSYLKSLEELPWHFFWQNVYLQTEEYPDKVIKLRVNTLSLEDAWIGG